MMMILITRMSKYVYIFVDENMCKTVCVCVCVCACVEILTEMLCLCKCMCVCVYVCMRMCICVFAYVYECVSMCVCVKTNSSLFMASSVIPLKPLTANQPDLPHPPLIASSLSTYGFRNCVYEWAWSMSVELRVDCLLLIEVEGIQ